MINSSLFSSIIRTIGICLFKVHSLRLFREHFPFHWWIWWASKTPMHSSIIFSRPLTHFTYPRCWRTPCPQQNRRQKSRLEGATGHLVLSAWCSLDRLFQTCFWKESGSRVHLPSIYLCISYWRFSLCVRSLDNRPFPLFRIAEELDMLWWKKISEVCGWKQLFTKYSKMWIFHPAGKKNYL